MQEGLGDGARDRGAVRDLVEGSGPGDRSGRQLLHGRSQEPKIKRNGPEDPPLQNPSLHGVILLK
jgi:hypothetical protein